MELIEINIHDWTHRLGHLAARLMPTSVTRLHRPAGSEGGMLRSGRGHMAVITEELQQHYGWCSTRTLEMRWGLEGARSLHPQPGLHWLYDTLTSREVACKATLMVAAAQSHASSCALPVTLAPHWPRAAHINATLISRGDDQPIMYSSLKI